MNGGFNSSNIDAMMIYNAKEQGYAIACQDILNIKPEDIDNDDEE